MKTLLRPLIILTTLLVTAAEPQAQCAAGWNRATINWDNLDYLTRNGTYNAFVSNQVRDTQYFTLGVNRTKIQLAGISTNGENTTNTAEAGSYGNGPDVEYSGLGTITISFDTVVKNLQFSLYDIDINQWVSIAATDAASNPLNINMTSLATGIVTITGSGGTSPTATASATAAGNNDTRGTLNIDINGGTAGIKQLVISLTNSSGNFWLSDLTACVYGSFPLDYYISQKPFTGQPAYYLVTPDNNSVYLFNPQTGVADWLFSEPVAPWVNSMAYDHVNKILYYVMDNPSPLSSNRSLKKYDFNTETVSTVIADISTLGIPLYEIVVESAGAAFYNGSLFLGIEGTNNAKNSARESIIWRIDFDASLKPVRASQAFARPADNGSGTLMHDWGDFSIKDGVLYDFNTGNSGSTAQFVHFNMQDGNASFFNTNGNPAPIQVGQTWNGTLYWTGGQSPEGGRVAVYNENGTIGPKIVATTTACSPGWVGRAGDASDPFRPKSDFGDAPDSYDPIPEEKATHEFNCNLRLGATYDREWDKTSSADAKADGADEDAISSVALLPRGAVTYVQDVKVYNNTGSNATLAAWLDYDGDGNFDPTEGIVRTIPNNAAMQTVTLSWPGIYVSLRAGTVTYLRLRITSASNGMTVNNATRWYSNGEVEDYPVLVEVILPTELLSFSAKAEANSRVKLNWSTGKETGIKGFEVERSRDGIEWRQLGYVAANLNGGLLNSYLHYDQEPGSGVSYYRLKLVSPDGSYQYSEVRTVELKQYATGLTISPNPVQWHTTIGFTLERNDMVNVIVTDANGRFVMNRMMQLNSGVHKIKIDNLQQFTPGVYMVRVVTFGGTLTGKMVIL
ncbi:MAG TPA: GEVED domain-containing protein [Chitinophagaceae bacterium]|nr:GEVED domain-containing protein [Chitinophagaceae bacterium]